MTSKSKSIIVALLAVATLVGTLFLASPAQAATHSNSQGVKNAGKNCVTQVSPIRTGQTSSDVQSFKCYTTFSASLAAATGNRINLPSNATRQTVSQAVGKYDQTNTASPDSENIILIFYVNANLGGASLIEETSGPSCGTGATYGETSMPSGWNDVVSSVAGGYYGCLWYHLWSDNDYSGTSQCYADTTNNVGSIMNDQTSSWYVRTYFDCGGYGVAPLNGGQA